MKSIKISVAIPYKQRLENMRIVLDALAAQSMDRADFEVIVGVMEYCPEYIALCREFESKLDILSVVTSRPFEIPKARNLAMRQAVGKVCVQMDADTLLPANALENLYDRYFADNQKQCIVGQVVGYGNNNDGDCDAVKALPYAAYSKHFEDLEHSDGKPKDPRFQVEHIVPWAFAWTGLIALRMDTIRQEELFFDEEFMGWGADDLEWGYRICATGTRIVLKEDVRAIHLPHLRDSEKNRVTGKRNFHRFLRKWPCPEVELASAFGDFDANALSRSYRLELKRASAPNGSALGIVSGRISKQSVLYAGVVLDANNHVVDRGILSHFDDVHGVEVLPLAGLSLPYSDKAVDECRALRPIFSLSERYTKAVSTEIERVGKRTKVLS